MARYEEVRTGGTLRYLVQGAAFGAILGVLFAPKRGSEIRQNVTDWINQGRRRGGLLARKARERFEEGKEELEEGYERDVERHDKEPMGI